MYDEIYALQKAGLDPPPRAAEELSGPSMVIVKNLSAGRT
jgi:hypothetical protein